MTCITVKLLVSFFFFCGGWCEVILALFITGVCKTVLLLCDTLLCSVSIVCVSCLPAVHLPGAVPDVNKSGQGICFCNCYSLCELRKSNTYKTGLFCLSSSGKSENRENVLMKFRVAGKLNFR